MQSFHGVWILRNLFSCYLKLHGEAIKQRSDNSFAETTGIFRRSFLIFTPYFFGMYLSQLLQFLKIYSAGNI